MKKTGKNTHLRFMCFELSDIVPVAESIFAEVGLLMVPTFGKEYAIVKVFNCDDRDEEPITSEAPFAQVVLTISNSGRVVTNEMQVLDSSITYVCRHLQQLALNIIEADSIDGTSGADEDAQTLPSPPKTAKKTPVTAGKCQEIKSGLTSAPEGAASEGQVATLKAELEEFMEPDAEQESFVQNVAVKTEGFIKIITDMCGQLITGIRDMPSAYDTQEGQSNEGLNWKTFRPLSRN